jgi:hypothetical protein
MIARSASVTRTTRWTGPDLVSDIYTWLNSTKTRLNPRSQRGDRDVNIAAIMRDEAVVSSGRALSLPKSRPDVTIRHACRHAIRATKGTT